MTARVGCGLSCLCVEAQGCEFRGWKRGSGDRSRMAWGLDKIGAKKQRQDKSSQRRVGEPGTAAPFSLPVLQCLRVKRSHFYSLLFGSLDQVVRRPDEKHLDIQRARAPSARRRLIAQGRESNQLVDLLEQAPGIHEMQRCT